MTEPVETFDPFEKLASEARLQATGEHPKAWGIGIPMGVEPAAPAPEETSAEDSGEVLGEEPEPDDVEPEEPPLEGEGGETDGGEAATSPTSFTVQVDGETQTVSQEEVANLLGLANLIRSDPLRAQQIIAVLEGQAEVVPVGQQQPPTAPEPPAELDLEDPAVKAVWDRLQALETQVGSYQAALNKHDQLLNNQQLVESRSLYARARRDFQTENGLTDVEMDRVDHNAANLNVLQGLVNSGKGRLEAISEAFKIGLRYDDDLYQRALAGQAKRQQEVRTKKARANAVSSGSGSTPRTPATPDRQSRDELMLTAMREAMNK